MTTKSDEHRVTLTGPGLSFKRPVTRDIANQIFNLVMTGVATRPGSSGSPAGAASHSSTGTGSAATVGLTAKQFLFAKRPGNYRSPADCGWSCYPKGSRNPRF